MAKSVRAKSYKRFRAVARATVGEAQVKKALRKTTRRLLKDVLGADAGLVNEEDVKAMMSGVNGESARLITLEPHHKKKLPFSFNTDLRAARLASGQEDETDDEAEEKDDKADKQARREAREAAEAEAEANRGSDDEDAGPKEIEKSGRTKNPDKPLPKRQMNGRYYEWEAKDLINPNVAGLYETEGKPSASRQRWLQRKKGKGKRRGRLAGEGMAEDL